MSKSSSSSNNNNNTSSTSSSNMSPAMVSSLLLSEPHGSLLLQEDEDDYHHHHHHHQQQQQRQRHNGGSPSNNSISNNSSSSTHSNNNSSGCKDDLEQKQYGYKKDLLMMMKMIQKKNDDDDDDDDDDDCNNKKKHLYCYNRLMGVFRWKRWLFLVGCWLVVVVVVVLIVFVLCTTNGRMMMMMMPSSSSSSSEWLLSYPYLQPSNDETEQQLLRNEYSSSSSRNKSGGGRGGGGGDVGRIKQISLLGERNSGTRWTFAHLGDCFNYSIPVERHLTRYKHWFQHDDATLYKHDTLVIAQFRNPIDWFKAMQRVPHHSPSHLDVDWKTFLSRPWTTPRYGKDLELLQQNGNSTNNITCQQRFRYEDIVSCVEHPLPREAYGNKRLRYSEETPFYEMRNDGSGLPYDNILQLRTDKIRNFVQIKETFSNIYDVWIVQYEYLLQRGTDHLIQTIANHTGIVPNCTTYPPQLRRSRPIEQPFTQYIVQHLNWTVEQWIGYTKPSPSPSPSQSQSQSHDDDATTTNTKRHDTTYTSNNNNNNNTTTEVLLQVIFQP